MRTCPTTSATDPWRGSSWRTARGRSAVGPIFTLGDPTISVSGTFSEHIVAARIGLQQAPCRAGFGVCDTDFNSLFFQFGLDPFALHAADPAGPWFLDPANVPES